MAFISNCPFGFEDGHIVAYRAGLSELEVDYEFWNEKRGRLVFDGFIGLHDNSAIGVTVGSAVEKEHSEFVDKLMHRLFEKPPDSVSWKHFQLLDLDDGAMFEVVAESCSFRE